jgi:CrcB protein
MLKSILLVGAGGFTGSVLRYLISRFMALETSSAFPFGTFIVNIAGCLIIGIIYGMGVKEMASSDMRLLLATGFCGGFTTFSSFSMEFFLLLRDGYTGMAFFYAGASMAVGLAAVWAGLMIAEGF